MLPADLSHTLVAAAAAFLAGAINSVAGGGTLVSFPTLVWLGLPSIVANATSTVAIWPGSLGSIWGFRREFEQIERRYKTLAFSSAFGGAVGAVLLRSTPVALFDRLVPFLILLATLLFALDGQIKKRLGSSTGRPDRARWWMLRALGLNFLVAVYGGYFGAGMSIMMLTSLSILGMTDILRMNALTSLFSLCVNGVAAALFISTGMVEWHYVVPMAMAAMVGGYGAAGVARRVGRSTVRRFVVVVGFSMTLALFLRGLN